MRIQTVRTSVPIMAFHHLPQWPALQLTAAARTAMSWFFKVSRGWAPYSAEQSEQIKAAWSLCQTGARPISEQVPLGEWRVDLEKMPLAANSDARGGEERR